MKFLLLQSYCCLPLSKTQNPIPSPRRVFGDKLVSHEDKGWLDKQLADLCKQEFLPDLCRQVDEPLYFVDFLREPTVDNETGEITEVGV
jgi:hypothetical protein